MAILFLYAKYFNSNNIAHIRKQVKYFVQLYDTTVPSSVQVGPVLCLYVCMYVCMYVRTYVRTYVMCIFVCAVRNVHIYMYVFICVCICLCVMCISVYV
jgi:hypothetical protein